MKVQSAATLGAYGLLEVVFQPQGGAPPHYHEQENESFYILEGEIEFQVAEKTYIASAGSFVHIPKGKIHSFIAFPSLMRYKIICVHLRSSAFNSDFLYLTYMGIAILINARLQ
nr:cupin domain-containing protein [Dolichospermum sp. UHCC 0315A]